MKRILILSAAALLLPAGTAYAGTLYVGGSVGLVDQSSSSNVGSTGAFTTGNLGDGSTLDVAAGTDYGWDTDFDNGSAFALEIGKRTNYGFRWALEAVRTHADVETHVDVTLGGGAIGSLDAASIASSADPLGVTVAQVVADGQGDLKQTAVFANVYYDFNGGGQLSPYVGAGIGFADVTVDYSPSAIAVIDDSQTKLAYQAKGGLTLSFDSPLELYGEVAYRASEDIETDNVLFPGTLDIENSQTSFSVGLRYSFG